MFAKSYIIPFNSNDHLRINQISLKTEVASAYSVAFHQFSKQPGESNIFNHELVRPEDDLASKLINEEIEIELSDSISLNNLGNKLTQ